MQIWLVTRHQCGISIIFPQISFSGKNQWWCPKCRLFSQANYYLEDDDLLILNYNIINCLLVNFRYFVAHSVGRPLIYPGSTGLLQSGFGNLKNNLECYFYWVYFYSHLYIRFAICR